MITTTDAYDAAAAQADIDLAHITAPAGTTTGYWERNLERDCWSRTLLWASHGEGEKATVDISGSQYDDGTHDVGITVWGVSEGEPLTAAQARRLAVHLLQAADSLSPERQSDADLLRQARADLAGYRMAAASLLFCSRDDITTQDEALERVDRMVNPTS